MTPHQVAAACGLQPPDMYVLKALSAQQEGAARKAGLTTRMLCEAVSAASQGQDVVILALPSYVREGTMFRLATGMATRAGLRIAKITGQWARLDRGSIRVESSEDPGMLKPGALVLRDHLCDKVPVVAGADHCLHRVERGDGRKCAACGQPLRGADLREARMRRATQVPVVGSFGPSSRVLGLGR